ncbi:MAG: metallophosphoesterase family protein [Deltaproteobacteria bacterium]|nr:metallophosphoesterase family protein [Deltaproteobacteria bacterium]
MEDKRKKRIGLIADSHGNLEATAEAIHLLKWRGADLLIHLGDFCDSMHPDRTAVMINLLRENGVLAVKGNNDWLVENILSDPRRSTDEEEKQTLEFLLGVPIVRGYSDILFAHSLPFDMPRAFHTPIDTGNTRRAEDLFNTSDFRILFCGHSHLPILFKKKNGLVTREAVPAGLPTVLEQARRYIIVVGAAAEGESALYDEETGFYERLQAEG